MENWFSKVCFRVEVLFWFSLRRARIRRGFAKLQMRKQSERIMIKLCAVMCSAVAVGIRLKLNYPTVTKDVRCYFIHFSHFIHKCNLFLQWGWCSHFSWFSFLSMRKSPSGWRSACSTRNALNADLFSPQTLKMLVYTPCTPKCRSHSWSEVVGSIWSLLKFVSYMILIRICHHTPKHLNLCVCVRCWTSPAFCSSSSKALSYRLKKFVSALRANCGASSHSKPALRTPQTTASYSTGTTLIPRRLLQLQKAFTPSKTYREEIRRRLLLFVAVAIVVVFAVVSRLFQIHFPPHSCSFFPLLFQIYFRGRSKTVLDA